MKLLFSDQPAFTDAVKPSLFLAGPTPRSSDVGSWRPEALKILEQLRFEGIVLLPERKDWSVKFEYEDQIEWEFSGLTHATVILFWVPRDLKTMPALTTNVEFGYWLARRPASIAYGRPENSAKNKYLDYLYEKETRRVPCETLEATIATALKLINAR